VPRDADDDDASRPSDQRATTLQQRTGRVLVPDGDGEFKQQGRLARYGGQLRDRIFVLGCGTARSFGLITAYAASTEGHGGRKSVVIRRIVVESVGPGASRVMRAAKIHGAATGGRCAQGRCRCALR
jgi:hypothetical protein